MFCRNCGAQLDAGAKFCTKCGIQVEGMTGGQTGGYQGAVGYQNSGGGGMAGPGGMANVGSSSGNAAGTGRTLCQTPDGLYTWRYDYHMFKKPGMFLSLVGIFFLVGFGVLMLVLIGSIFSGNIRSMDEALEMIKIGFIIGAVMAVLSALGYLITAAAYHGKYEYVYLMGVDGVFQTQTDRQLRWNRGVGMLAAAGGAARGNFAIAGGGLSSARRTGVGLEFGKMRKIKPNRNRNYIHVKQKIQSMKVRVGDEDFDFVKDFMIRNCPNAVVE